MILPIVAYGHSLLRRKSVELNKDYPGLNELIENMFETMYETSGVGLAAPQVNLSIRLVVLDATPFADDVPEAKGFKKAMINPVILEESGEEWKFNEGCLSIPEVREDVLRKPNIHIQYYDENFVFHDEKHSDVMARVIQHEYDHLEGVLFVDRVPGLRKVLLRRKLLDISKGNINVDYRMIFPNRKKRRR